VTAAAATASLDFRRGFAFGGGGIGETYTFGWVASLEIVGVRVASVVSVRTRVRLMGRGPGGTALRSSDPRVDLDAQLAPLSFEERAKERR
jgi:hypothetical protein